MKILKKTVRSLNHNIQRFNFLIRHFHLRFINNDTLKFDKHRRENLITIFALLAALGGVIAHFLLRLYLFGLKTNPDEIWMEQTYFMVLLMAIVGIIFTIVWPNLSLDRRDYINLLVLPVKINTLIITKFISVFIFVFFTTIIFNLLSTIIFTFYISRTIKIAPLRFGISHFSSHFVAYLFIIFLIACLQGLLKTVCKEKWYKRLSAFFQIVLFSLFISVMVWFPNIYPLLESLRAKSSAFIFYFPPMWFVGLSEKMMGKNDLIFTVHLYLILIAFTVLFCFYVLNLSRDYRNYLNLMPRKSITSPISKHFIFLKKAFHSIFLKNPLERVIFYLTSKTLNRSKKHKNQLAVYIIIPFGITMIALLFLYYKNGVSFFKEINLYLISIPLIFIFFLTMGLRNVISHPVNITANWIFRFPKNYDERFFVKGLKKAFFFTAFIPFFILLFSFYLYIWGIRPAIYHSLFFTAIFLLLINVFFSNYSKIPFISRYVSGKINNRLLWPFLMIGFLVYMYIFTVMGIFLIQKPEYYIIFYAIVMFISFLLKWVYYYYHQELVFTYNKALESVIVGLDFDHKKKDFT